MTKPAPVKIRGVHHFAMSVPSLESAIAFYRDAFGFEVVDHEHLGHSEEDDVHESHQALKAHGVKWHSDPIDAGDGYLMTYGRDPFGNVIEIQQVPNERAYAFAQLRGE
jgi:uncharacterized glyoxalase superfamily protein PhnB